MFFTVRKIKGIEYLYLVNSFRSKITGKPTNSSGYVGPVEQIERAINKWRERECKSKN